MALGWPAPARVLDLFAEYCDHRNGRDGESGRSLLAALMHFGLDSIGTVHKKQMIDRILKGPPFTEEERRDILDYCWSDVYALERLLPAMLPDIEWKGALVRGRYAHAVAAMETAGIPVNAALLDEVVARWSEIQGGLIREIDRDYGVYDGTTFKADRFEAFVERHGIPWPRRQKRKGQASAAWRSTPTPSATWRRSSPSWRRSRSCAMRLARCAKMMSRSARTAAPGRVSARSRRRRRATSRARQSFCTAQSKWIRHFIQPEPGHALVYFDFSAEEVGIAAALSGDKVMQAGLSRRRLLRELRRLARPAAAGLHQGDRGRAVSRRARPAEDRQPGDALRHGADADGVAHREVEGGGRAPGSAATAPATRCSGASFRAQSITSCAAARWRRSWAGTCIRAGIRTRQVSRIFRSKPTPAKFCASPAVW